MKIAHILPLTACVAAFVIPDEATAKQLRVKPESGSDFWDRLPSEDAVQSAVESTVSHLAEESRNALDDAFSLAFELGEEAEEEVELLKSRTGSAAQFWFDSVVETDDVDFEEDDMPISELDHDHHGHHGHHGHCDHKPNMTVYQLISESKYTTKLAKLINEDEGLVRVLNSTHANYTVFAPTDHAFEKIPKHGDKPSKEFIKKVLLYHISPDFYPASRVLVSHTIPTLLKEESLGNNPQRIRVGLGLKGLELNFYSRIVAINIVCLFSPPSAS